MRKVGEKTYLAEQNGTRVLIGGSMPDKFVPNLNFSKWDDERFWNINLPVNVTNQVETFDNGRIEINVGGFGHVFYERNADEIEYEIILFQEPPRNYFDFNLAHSPDVTFHNQLDLYRQWEVVSQNRNITLEDFLATHTLPERGVDSIAIYCNLAHGKYQTGKLGHIYRPHLTDALGNECWGSWELRDNNTVLRLSAPAAWLASATYPVVVDPTFGTTSYGVGNEGFTADYLGAVVASAPASSGTGDSISVRCAAYTASTYIKGVLLNHDSSDNIVTNGVGNAVECTFEVGDWYTSAFGTAPTITSGTVYYPAFVVSQSNFYCSADYMGSTYPDDWYGRIDTTNSYSSPANPGTLGLSEYRMSIYCTYTATGATLTEEPDIIYPSWTKPPRTTPVNVYATRNTTEAPYSIATVADGVQRNAGDAPTLTQNHDITAADGVQRNVGDSVVLAQNHTLDSVADGVQRNVADSFAVTETVVMSSVADGVQRNVGEAIVLAQNHTITITDGIQRNVGEAVTTTQNQTLATVTDGIQRNVGDEPALAQNQTLATASDGIQRNVGDSIVLEQSVGITSVADGIQRTVADVPVLTQNQTITVSDGVQITTADPIVVTEEAPGIYSIATVADGVQRNVAEVPTPTQNQSVTITDGIQRNVGEALTLAQNQTLATVADGIQRTVGDAPALTQNQTAIISDGVQNNYGEPIVLGQNQTLASVADGVQRNVAEGVVVTENIAGSISSIADGIQRTVADAPTLTQNHVLTVGDGVQRVVSDAPILTQTHALTIADGVQLNYSTIDALIQNHVLTISDAIQANTADSIVLTEVAAGTHIIASVADCIQRITDDGVLLIQVIPTDRYIGELPRGEAARISVQRMGGADYKHPSRTAGNPNLLGIRDSTVTKNKKRGGTAGKNSLRR